MISPLPGATPTKPGSATKPLPGVEADILTRQGEPVADNLGGFLVIKRPFPSMLRTIWGDDKRFIDTYWSRFGAGAGQGDDWVYFAGDGAKRDDDGALWLLGRVDDVMLISGHNISTTEVESALVSHPSVAESAVVGATDATTGQAIVAFVIPRGNVDTADDKGEQLIVDLRNHVAKVLGPIAKPRQIMLVPELPKTRSGKIMRRLLKDVAENRSLGDVTTLQDSAVMDLISDGMKTAKPED
jgi:acetyl-CoA synthetase